MDDQSFSALQARTAHIPILIARLGGDEFVVLAVNARANGSGFLRERLEENIRRYNAEHARFPLSLSCGLAQSEARGLESLDELIAKADRDLYGDKQDSRG